MDDLDELDADTPMWRNWRRATTTALVEGCFEDGPKGAFGSGAVQADVETDQEARIHTQRTKAKADLLSATARMRGSLSLGTRDLIKGSFLADPDMWPGLHSFLSEAMDCMWVDVEAEIERNLHNKLLLQHEDSFCDEKGPEGGPAENAWWRFRAFLLHHYLPHDRQIFGKLKDPYYLLIMAAICVPIHGLRVAFYFLLLLMILFPWRPDEFQLINFILIFKGMQFLTSGIMQLCSGSFMYFKCYSLHKSDLLDCIDTRGPGGSDGVGPGMDYLGSIVLVWMAFLLLPYSQKRVPNTSKEEMTSHRRYDTSDGAAAGRLQKLLKYDMKCFTATFLILIALTVALCSDQLQSREGVMGLMHNPQFAANVWLTNVIYSLLSLPFCAFAIPGWQAVLVHSDPTGWNSQGACVALARAKKKQVAGQDVERRDRSLQWMKLATNVVQLIEDGRALRGSSEGGLMSDLKAGILQSLGLPAYLGGQSDARRTQDRTSTLDSAESEMAHVTLDVSSLRVVGTEKVDGVDFFRIACVAEGSLDAGGGTEPWEVLRRYAQFRELGRRLGPASHSYAEARFPSRQLRSCTPQQLEDRRRALEAWLCCVVHDIHSQEDSAVGWARIISDFLDPETPAYAAGPKAGGQPPVVRARLSGSLESLDEESPSAMGLGPQLWRRWSRGRLSPSRPMSRQTTQGSEFSLSSSALSREEAFVPPDPGAMIPAVPASLPPLSDHSDGTEEDGLPIDCASAGDSSPHEPTAVAAQHWLCDACGELNKPERLRCNSCGRPRPEEDVEAAAAAAPAATAGGERLEDLGELSLGQVTFSHVLRGLRGAMRQPAEDCSGEQTRATARAAEAAPAAAADARQQSAASGLQEPLLSRAEQGMARAARQVSFET